MPIIVNTLKHYPYLYFNSPMFYDDYENISPVKEPNPPSASIGTPLIVLTIFEDFTSALISVFAVPFAMIESLVSMETVGDFWSEPVRPLRIARTESTITASMPSLTCS